MNVFYSKFDSYEPFTGIRNLTNAKPGDYYGPAREWPPENQLKLGTFLLYRAFKIFLQEGERQIRPVDLKIVPKS